MVSFKEQIANYVLGNVGESALIEAATSALLEGFDTKHLRILAAENERNYNAFEVLSEFRIALSEMGFVLPSEQEAASTLICFWCRQILQGLVNPYEGAEHIVNEVYYRLSSLGHEKLVGESIGMSAIIGCYYEFGDLQEGFIEYEGKKISKTEAEEILERHIVAEASKYLEEKCT